MIQRYNGIEPTLDPTAWVHPIATVIGDVVLGPYVSVWPSAVLRGDCGPIRVGAYSNIQDGTIVHTTQDISETHIGERVTIGHSSVIHGCRIDDDCLVGMNSTILDNAELGVGTLVAANSLVSVGKSFPEGGLLVGSPARLARPLSDSNVAMIDNGWRSYVEYARPFRDGRVETVG